MKELKYPELDDKEWLYQKYWVEKKSLHEIADLLGCNFKRVWRALEREGIPRRTISESRKGQYPSEETKQKLRGRRKSRYDLIKNFLHLDYPCGKTTGYYAKVMLLRSTGNFYILYKVTLWQATGNSQVKQ